jgi:DNA polymerase (family 10)
MHKGEVIEMLEEYELLLRVDGMDGKAAMVGMAAQSIREVESIPPDPMQIDGIGPFFREMIVDFQMKGTNEELEELRRWYPYARELTQVDGIGPTLARRLHDHIGVTTVRDLLDVDLTEVRGVGDATADAIRMSAMSVMLAEHASE